MDATLPARRDFLNLARRTLTRFGASPAIPDVPQLGTEAKVAIGFEFAGADFAFVHDTDPKIDNLMLVKCAFGPLHPGSERESCMRMLEANYELSVLSLTGFALDENRHAVYTHSCAMLLWDGEGMAELIESMAALALRWRDGGILDVEGLGALSNHATRTLLPALA